MSKKYAYARRDVRMSGCLGICACIRAWCMCVSQNFLAAGENGVKLQFEVLSAG